MQKNISWLLLFFLTGSSAFSQHKEKEWAIICGDCSYTKVKDTTRHRWHPYVGIHVSGDAEMFYVGPSFQAGTDFMLTKRVLLSTYIHYFGKKVNNAGANGFFENGKFKTIPGTVLIQVNTARNLNRSFFIGLGAAVQRWRDNYSSSFDSWDDKRTTITPAMRLGYFLPVGNNKISVELNGTGPYKSGDAASYSIEILTQISFGVRYIF